jgi:hypothetical protein
MNQEQPLYGELVIPFNAEDETHTHDEAMSKSKEMRAQIEQAAYYLSKERGFISGHELEDWLKAEIQVLRTLK